MLQKHLAAGRQILIASWTTYTSLAYERAL